MNARNYLFEHEPGRHALVLGNSDYDNLAPLHSARLDAKRMSAELEQLGFAVTLVTRLPSVRAFEDDVLPPFRDTIKPGDMVLFYFSGHGFAYGPNNFLAPANLPLVVSGERVSECAIAVESVEDYLARQSPGVVLMFIDACRTIAGLVIKDSGTPSVVSASMRRVASPERIDIVEAFAARAGNAEPINESPRRAHRGKGCRALSDAEGGGRGCVTGHRSPAERRRCELVSE